MMMVGAVVINEVIWLYFYETFWGFLFTTFSIMATVKAVWFPKSQWVWVAQLSTECAHTLNLVITPLFWIVLAPMVYPSLSWHGIDLYTRLHLFTLHAFPIIFTTVNIVLTDMQLDPNDWKKMVFMGF